MSHSLPVGRFKNSKFGSDDDIEAMARAFDKADGVKCIFSDPEIPYYIQFGSMSDMDKEFGISGGSFAVEGPQVAEFFEPAVQDIIDGVKDQCDRAKDGTPIKILLLVGGFARSEYLYRRLNDHFRTGDIVVFRPDATHLYKAVAEGAVSYYLDHYVTTRVARLSYGVMTRHLFNDKNPEHLDRESTKLTQANGKSYIPGIFDTILIKDTEVSEEMQFRHPHRFILTRGQFATWTSISTRLKCYRGRAATPPKWVDLEPGLFDDACTIQADMSHIKSSMKLQKNGTKLFYKLDLEMVIGLGLTELKAYATWQENGEEMRCVSLGGFILFYPPHRLNGDLELTRLLFTTES
ncbi:hypothetical protein M378DRAFT_171084, partial [Amanita muscaria Koide BX008]